MFVEAMQPIGALECSYGEVKEQDAETLRLTYEAHYRRLVRLAGLIAGTDRAEDLVHEAFVRSAGRIPQLSQAQVYPYLRVAILNLWRNELRRRSLEQRVLRRRPRELLEVHSPEEAMVIWAAIQLLPLRQRACVVLRYYEDMTEREVAGALKCSIGTVKSQTSRALIRLERELHEN